MADKLFSRVIMRLGGDVHIAFWDKKAWSVLRRFYWTSYQIL